MLTSPLSLHRDRTSRAGVRKVCVSVLHIRTTLNALVACEHWHVRVVAHSQWFSKDKFSPDAQAAQNVISSPFFQYGATGAFRKIPRVIWMLLLDMYVNGAAPATSVVVSSTSPLLRPLARCHFRVALTGSDRACTV